MSRAATFMPIFGAYKRVKNIIAQTNNSFYFKRIGIVEIIFKVSLVLDIIWILYLRQIQILHQAARKLRADS